MKKVYIVWSVPDYIGITIEGVFAEESQARAYCDKLISSDKYANPLDYGVDEYEVM